MLLHEYVASAAALKDALVRFIYKWRKPDQKHVHKATENDHKSIFRRTLVDRICVLVVVLLGSAVRTFLMPDKKPSEASSGWSLGGCLRNPGRFFLSREGKFLSRERRTHLGLPFFGHFGRSFGTDSREGKF